MSSRDFLCRHALLPSGWARDVLISVADDGKIASLTTAATTSPRAERLGIVVPGMVNLHSHAFQRAMAGLAEQAGPTDDSFWTWREVMYRLVDVLDVDDVRAIALWLNVELLQRGYTCLGEFHYLHHQSGGQSYDVATEMSDAVIAAASTTGMRLTHMPTLYTYGGFGDRPLGQSGQQRFANSLDSLLSICDALVTRYQDQPRIKIGCAAHSLRAVNHRQLTGLRDAWLQGSQFDRPNTARRLHLHIAEQAAEVAACQSHLDRRPVEWLLEQFDVDDRWCLIHATHASAAEIAAIVASRAIVGWCPTTEANLGDGVLAGRLLHDLKGRWGIGSDSHVSVCPYDELRALEYGQRLVAERRNVMVDAGAFTGVELYAAAARDGAAALDQPTGQLTEGAQADLVELADDHPLLAGRSPDQVLNTHVFCGTVSRVTSVIVGGEWIVRDGQHRDHSEHAQAFAACMRRLTSLL